ncbi:DUF2270 domain-containing protein [Limibaculum sp. M0105]|uniref:DUF2270 domain-containing protein n=1 Tax=Thermohalobaculum xanthum TaxID=2753746 RepID=A0A8J7M805_9RHOB|nr:DUF2270 domain-containing protein [Thermohalobaculum xanthum]MBK0400034.1 DUF2270 domain-containing protein [Thermohalobaculum xanthum]
MVDGRVPEGGPAKTFSGPELGAIAHLYRGEVYRSTIWRSRLDNTTNWAVVTTGVALSLAYAEPMASPLPLVLVGLLVVVFLAFEARRYRYFNVWRARCRLMETDIYAPLLRGEGVTMDGEWNTLLANDYARPRFHISYARAVGRRLRKNYAYILAVQAIAYYGKLAIHPSALENGAQIFERATIGPVPGEVVVLAGVVFHLSWIALAFVTLRIERRYRRPDKLISIA